MSSSSEVTRRAAIITSLYKTLIIATPIGKRLFFPLFLQFEEEGFGLLHSDASFLGLPLTETVSRACNI